MACMLTLVRSDCVVCSRPRQRSCIESWLPPSRTTCDFYFIMASAHSYVSLGTLQRTGYAMVAITTAFVLARAGIQIGRRKMIEVPDCLLYVAYIFYAAVCALYLFMAPRLFRFNDVLAGKAEPWSTMQRDVVVLYNSLFVNTLLFWTCLWCAKLSLLVLYRKLMTGLPYVYMRIWWAVAAFCVLVSMALIMSYGSQLY